MEVLEASLAYYVDARNNDISLMVDAMRSRAQRRKNPSLLLRTRRKNAEAAEAEADEASASEPAPSH